MEKKKLVEIISKSFKLTEECLDQGYFLTTEDDQSTAKLVKLFDKFVLIHTVKCALKQNAGKVEPWGRINFDFDLIFQAVRGQSTEDKRPRVKGIKFERGDEVCFLFNSNPDVVRKWREVLAARLNQRGFHQLFKPIKKIGKGNFASVYLAIRLEDEKKFAIKAFSKEATYGQDKGKESLVNEIQLMRRFNHKNLMRLFEVYQSQNSIYVSVELLEGGQLYDKIKAKHQFTPEQILSSVRGLLMGLEHMHAKRVMHRDLKPENILLRKDNDYDCVIADFGLSTWADQPEYLFVRCGTPGYVAPQIVNLKDLKAKCDPICDVFSLGVIFHVLLLGKSPFPGKTYNQVLSQNRACNFNFEAEEYSKLPPMTMDLLKKMLAIDPKQRITAKDALLHPFLGQVQVQPFSVLPPSLLPVLQPQNNKQSHNKTSILAGKGACDSPLMTSSNPFRRIAEPLKEDSCLKFKMKESVMTGKTTADDFENSSIDSPSIKKNSVPQQPVYKESRFGQDRKNLLARDSQAI